MNIDLSSDIDLYKIIYNSKFQNISCFRNIETDRCVNVAHSTDDIVDHDDDISNDGGGDDYDGGGDDGGGDDYDGAGDNDDGGGNNDDIVGFDLGSDQKDIDHDNVSDLEGYYLKFYMQIKIIYQFIFHRTQSQIREWISELAGIFLRHGDEYAIRPPSRPLKLYIILSRPLKLYITAWFCASKS